MLHKDHSYVLLKKKVDKNRYNIQNTIAVISVSRNPCHAFAELQVYEDSTMKNTGLEIPEASTSLSPKSCPVK
jgi:hypothetical protein